MISGLLRLWINSKVPHMDMDHPHPCHTKHIMIFSSMLVIRYDKTEKANICKRRNVYNTNIDTPDVDYPTDVIDYVPDSSHGGIDLPPDEIRSMSFPLGIHLLQGLETPPDHFSDPILNNQAPKSTSKSRMALFTCHLKPIIVESACNESFEGL